jgi:hypothetical protein
VYNTPPSTPNPVFAEILILEPVNDEKYIASVLPELIGL